MKKITSNEKRAFLEACDYAMKENSSIETKQINSFDPTTIEVSFGVGYQAISGVMDLKDALGVINENGAKADIRFQTPDGPVEIKDVWHAHISMDKKEMAIIGDKIISSEDISQHLAEIQKEIDEKNKNMSFSRPYVGRDGKIYESFGNNPYVEGKNEINEINPEDLDDYNFAEEEISIEDFDYYDEEMEEELDWERQELDEAIDQYNDAYDEYDIAFGDDDGRSIGGWPIK